jgi:hypothetical protein
VSQVGFTREPKPEGRVTWVAKLIDQRRLQRCLPPGNIQTPADVRFSLVLHRAGPGVFISGICGHIQPIDYGHPAGQLARGFNLYVVRAGRQTKRRVQGNRHSNRIRQRNSVLARLLEIRLLRRAVRAYHEFGERRVESEDALDIGETQRGVSTAEVPTDHFDGEPGAEDNAGSFWVHPDVVLGGRRDIAFTARSPTHDDATSDARGKPGFAGKREGQVGQRSESDDFDAGIRADCSDDGIYGMTRFRPTSAWSVAVIAEAIFAVEPVGSSEFSQQRRFRPSVDRHIGAAQLRAVERVAGGLRGWDIAGDHGDSGDADFLGAQRHNECHGVIGSGIGIDQERSWHLRAAWCRIVQAMAGRTQQERQISKRLWESSPRRTNMVASDRSRGGSVS